MDQKSAPVVQYRCVCGAEVEVNPRAGGTCPACDRYVSQRMLSGDVTQTIVLPGDSLDTQSTVPAQLDDADMIGKQLEHFRIVSRLGQGGMGAVYTALDESLQRYVALKVISNLQAACDTQHVERLLQEARAQARVNHPNVVHIYYVSRGEDEMPFLAMELIQGPTLADRLRKGPLSYKDVVDIGLQVVEALRQSARFDIVHGDIKPGNILLSDGKRVKLSDFGLSQRISLSDQKSGPIAGTPSYMAPELFEGAAPNVQTDQYALGVMLFEMTFGRMPYTFDSGTVRDAMRAHTGAAVEFPEPWPGNLPESWHTLLTRLLTKNPADRFGSFDDVGYHLFHARPLPARKAGRLVRGMAWMIDWMLCIAPLSVVLLLIELLQRVADSLPAFGTLLLVVAAIVLTVLPVALVGFVQSRWGTTPGKKLMQIRIVDQHGLRPDRWRLGLRVIPQLLPAWALHTSQALELVFPNALANTVASVFLCFTALDTLWAMFAKGGRSLHDLFFGTQVVQDVGRT